MIKKLFNPCVLFYYFSYYQILVHRVQDWNDTVTDWKDFGSNFYISAQIPASDVKTKMMFLLGDGENKGGYNNKELSSGLKYKIYARALTEVTSKVDIFSIEWLWELKTKQRKKLRGRSHFRILFMHVLPLLLTCGVGGRILNKPGFRCWLFEVLSRR